MVGIYKITNPKNRIYIGQSVNLEKRLNSYKRLYVKNKGITKLYRSLIKHGVENHTFEIIEECSVELLNERERYYQDFYNCVEKGLNCRYTKNNDKSGSPSSETLLKMSIASKGNKNWLGKKHSQETKDKISKANSGRKYSIEVNKSKGRKGRVSNRKGIFSENNPLSKKVLQFDLNNNLIKEWNCLMDIKRELGFHIGNVSSCLKGNLKTYKKFIWKYK
jgi:group I intron endonuclease